MRSALYILLDHMRNRNLIKPKIFPRSDNYQCGTMETELMEALTVQHIDSFVHHINDIMPPTSRLEHDVYRSPSSLNDDMNTPIKK